MNCGRNLRPSCFFSHRFSESKARSFSSDSSMPPYFDLYLWKVLWLIPKR